MTWIEAIKQTRPLAVKRQGGSKRANLLEKFLLKWLTDTVGYSSRFRYEKVRTKMNPLWNDSSKRGFSNDWMLSRLVDHLEMKHYGQHITREKNKEDA
tara:strand:+ start:207 stop:500 length:294 start_codon:yes stop_codon:yes gene_type:complete